MASYIFKCDRCSMALEEIMPMASATFEDRPCPIASCEGKCVYRMTGAPAVATANMSNPSFDVVVGADAEKRWKKIHERQENRDKIRLSSGERALKAVSVNDFQPLKGAKLTGVTIPESAQERF